MTTDGEKLLEVCERVASVETEVKGVNRHMEQMTLQNEKILERLSDLKDRVTEKSALISHQGEQLKDLDKRLHHVESVQKTHQALFDRAKWSWKTISFAGLLGAGIVKFADYAVKHLLTH